MEKIMNKQALRVLGAASVLAVAAVSAQAAGTNGTASAPTPPTYNAGYGPGYGMGPWMMGAGYGGWGGGYGPGMMGGFGGYGMGPWMMGLGYGGLGGPYGIKLSDAQIQKIEAIEKAQFDKQWLLMRDMQQTMVGAWGANNASGLDVDAVMKRATALSNLRLQMLRNRLEAQKQIDAVLTKDQRERLGLTP
jgi:Spy/CpxP family protein refolding chaperone